MEVFYPLLSIIAIIKKRQRAFKALALLLLSTAALPQSLFAQTPTVSYGGSSYVYTTNTTITDVIPTGTNVSAPSLAAQSVFYTPINTSLLAVDGSGNTFFIASGSLKMAPAGGGAAVAISTSFTTLSNLKVDQNGTLYIVDKSTGTVAQITTPASGGRTITNIITGLNSPNDIAVGNDGTIYTAGGGVVSKYPVVGGVVGSGIVIANVSNVLGIAVDGGGNVYTVDDFNLLKIPATNTAYPISQANLITVGSGFFQPSTVAVDNIGDVFVDNFNNSVPRISMVDPSGTITTISGTGPAGSFFGMAVDLQGNAYYASGFGGSNMFTVKRNGGYYISPALPAGLSFDSTTGKISGTPLKASPQTTYTITALNSTSNTSATTTINIKVSDTRLASLSISAGTLSPAFNASTTSYTAQAVHLASVNVTLSPVDPTSTVTYNGSTITPGVPFAITGLTIGSVNSLPFVVTTTDATTNTYTVAFNDLAGPIASYNTPNTFTVGTPASLSPTSSNSVSAPAYASQVFLSTVQNEGNGVAVDAAGNIYTYDFNSRLVKIPAGGGTAIAMGGGFVLITGIAIDKSGALYVADEIGSTVTRITNPGQPGSTQTVVASGFNNIGGIAVDASGNLYVGENNSHCVDKFTMVNGVSTSKTIIVNSGITFPYGLAVDAAGNLYIADNQATNIIEVPASATTYPVDPSNFINLFSNLATPVAVAVDNAGNVFVGEENNGTGRVTKLDPSGVSTVLSGAIGAVTGVGVDAKGNVYYTDVANSKLYETALNGGYYISPTLPSGLTFNGTTGVISGTSTVGSPATNYEVDVYNSSTNASTSSTVNIKVTSTNANLSGISAGVGNLSPTFSSGVTTYTLAEASTSPSSVIISATADPGASISINGGSATLGSASATVPFSTGSTPVAILVTAADGSTTKTYTVNINKLALPVITYNTPNNYNVGTPVSLVPSTSNVSSLSYSGTSTFSPVNAYSQGIAFDAAGNLFYNDGGGVSEIPVGTTDPVSVNSSISNIVGIAVDASGNLYVAHDSEIDKITNPGQAGSTTTPLIQNISAWSVAVDHAGNVYANDQTKVTKYVIANNAVASSTVLATNFSNIAQIVVDGAGNLFVADASVGFIKKIPANATGFPIDATTLTSVASNIGYASGMAVDNGGNLIVTDASGSGAVNRVDVATGNLTNLASSTGYMISIAAGPDGTIVYSSYADPSLFQIKQTAGFRVSPALPSSLLLNANTGEISGTPSIGGAVANYTVTAYNAASETAASNVFSIKVTSTNASLSSLGITPGVVTPVLAPGTTTYAAMIADTTNSITLAAVADPTATISINGGTATTGSANAVISTTANSAISILVTAGDGTTTKTYTINITKVGPATLTYTSPNILPTGTPANIVPTTSNLSALGYADQADVYSTSDQVDAVTTDAAGNIYYGARGTLGMISAADGTNTTIRSDFDFITGVALDASGNLYVNDNTTIYKVTDPLGAATKTTFANTSSFLGGIVLDAAGNIYISVSGSESVQKFTVVNGTLGTTTMIAEEFNNATGIAIDKAGNLYIADQQNNNVKIIPATNTNYPIDASTLSTVGTGFNQPYGITIDNGGNLFVSESGSGNIKRIDAATGATSTIQTGFGTPEGLTVDGTGKLYVTDWSDFEIYSITQNSGIKIAPALPAGLVFNVANGAITGTPTVGSPTTTYAVTAFNALGQSNSNSTVSIKVVSSNANLSALTIDAGTLSPAFAAATTTYTANVASTVSAITINTTAESTASIAVNGGTSSLGTNASTISLTPGTNVISVVVIAGDGVSTKTYTLTVTKLGLPTLSYTTASSYKTGDVVSVTPTSTNVSTLGFAQQVAINNTTGTIGGWAVATDASNNLYVSLRSSILKVTPAGVVTTLVSSGITNVNGMVADGSGNLYATDYTSTTSASGRILKIDGTGAITALVTNLIKPAGLAFDGAGNLYVVESNTTTNSHDVKKYSGGNFTTPLIISTAFSKPTGIAIDKAGNVYIADANKTGIYKIPASLTNSTGVALASMTIIASTMGTPTSVAVDNMGNLYAGMNEFFKRVDGTTLAVTTISDQPTLTPTGVAIDQLGNLNLSYSGNFVPAYQVKPLGGYYVSPALPAGLTVNATTGLISGTPTATTALTAYTIYGYNAAGEPGSTTVSFSTVDLSLSNLVISAGTLSPAFSASVSKFTATEASATASVNITPTVHAVGSTVAINGTTVTSGAASAQALAAGLNTFYIKVTGVDGVTTATDTLLITRFGPPTLAYAGPQAYAVGAAITPLNPTATNVSTYAYGTGTTSATSLFTVATPTGIAVDANAIYVYNGGTNNITKRLFQGGTVTTLGSGISQGANLALDAAGNLYVADQGANNIKKITPGNVQTTLPVNVTSPSGVAIDAAGNLYVSQYSNTDVVKFAAGTGAKTVVATGFTTAEDVALDAAGNIYVLDGLGGAVYKIPANTSSTVTASSLTAIATGLGSNSSGLTVDASGNIFVTNGSKAVILITPAGAKTTISTTAMNANFGITAGPAGVIYVADNGAGKVFQLPPLGGYFLTTPLPTGLTLDANTGIISGTPTASTPATIYTISGYNGEGVVATATVSIQTLGHNPLLASLTVDPLGVVSPVFDPNTDSYSVSVKSSASSVTITPTPADLSSTITVNSSPLSSGAAVVPIIAGTNTITIVVTAPDGSTTKTYTLAVTQAAAPAIAYNSTPIVYPPGAAITPVSPTSSSNIATPKFDVKTIVSQQPAINAATGIIADAAGNIYLGGNAATLQKIAVGGAITTLGSGFSNISNITMDAAGNIYVADQNLTTIQKITPGGVQTTIGTGLSQPMGVAVDAAGNVYVTELTNNDLKKISIVTGNATILVTGLNAPHGLAVDASGNVYIADYQNNVVRKLPAGATTSAAASTLATVGTGLSQPTDLSVDASGNLFIASSGNNNIVKISGAGTQSTVASGFSNVYGVATDGAGNIYTTDLNAGAIYKNRPIGGYYITPAIPAGLVFHNGTGTISGTPIAGSAATTYTITAYNNVGESATATVNFQTISGIVALSNLVSSNGTLSPTFASNTLVYTLSTTASAITLTPTTVDAGVIVKINGTTVASGAASASIPLNVGLNTINISVTNSDGSANNVYRVAATRVPAPSIAYSGVQSSYNTGSAIASLVPTSSNVDAFSGNGFSSTFTTISTNLVNPLGIAVDDPGNLYITNYGIVSPATSALYKFTPTTNGFSAPQQLAGSYNQPFSVAVDNLGNNYVADGSNNLLKNGTVLSISAITNKEPFGVTVDALGNVFVGLGANGAIIKIPAYGTGTAVTFATGFTSPQALTTDAAGNLYVADDGTGIITKIDRTGAKTVLASNLESPNGIAIDGTGNIYTTDDHRLLMLPAGGGAPVNMFPATTFASLWSLAIDKTHKLYLTSSNFTDINGVFFTKSLSPVNGYYISPTLPAGLTFDNTSGTISGTPTASSPATTYTITAYNGNGNASTTINFKTVASDATLSNLALSTGVLLPTFSAATTTYTSTVISTATTLTVTPTVTDPGATVTVNGTAVASGAASSAITINAGSNTITVVVTAADGTTTKTYTLTVVRAPSLRALTATASPSVSLSPTFTAGTYTYTGSTTASTVKITPTITTADAGGTIKVNGTTVNSGSASGSIALVVGANTIPVTVTSTGGAVATYNVVINVTGTTAQTITFPTITTTQFGTADFSPGASSSSGLPITYTSSKSGVTIVNGNIHIVAPVTNVVITATQAGNNTYAAATKTVTFTVSKGTTVLTMAPTATVPLGTVDYGPATSNNPETDVTYTSSNTAVATGGLNVQIVGIGSTTITANQAATTDYTATSASQILTVSQAASVINLAAFPPMQFGDADFAPVATSNNTDSPITYSSSNTAVATITAGNLIHIVGVGDADITASQLGSTNYTDATSVVKHLTVAVGTPLITFATLPTLNYGHTDFTLNATSSNSVTSITYTSSDPTVATVTSNTVHITGAGTAIITASQAAGNNFNAATDVPQSLTIGQRAITATADAQTRAYGTADPALTYTITSGSLVGLDQLSGTLTRDAGEQPGTYAINQGSLIANGNYNLSFTAGTLTITPTIANEAELSNLLTSAGTINQISSTAYTVTLSGLTITTVRLKAITTDPLATLTINGNPAVSNVTTPDITLNSGTSPTIIPIVILAEDGVTTKTIQVTVNRIASPNTDLKNLALGGGIIPTQASATQYIATVSAAQVTVRATVADASSTLTINGISVASGTYSGNIGLASGDNSIPIVIAAEDGTMKTYTLIVTKIASSNADLKSLAVSGQTPTQTTATTFTATVASTTATVRATTADAGATVKINGVTVASGAYSDNISLIIGANTIPVVITAADGTMKAYTLTVTRLPSSNNDLKSLAVSGQTPTQTDAISYTASVTTATVTVRAIVADVNATVKINGTTVVSGTYSGNISLTTGANTITALVTAEDGTPKTYTLTVTRLPSSNNDLKSLTVSGQTPTQTDAISYTASVTTATVTVRAIVADANATVKINGTTVVSGTYSGNISLTTGANTITVLVTAEDGTPKTYTLTVTRLQSSNNDLKSLAVSGQTPTQADATTYTASVTTATVTVRTIVADAGATVKINGTAVASGSYSNPISLTTGANTITILITAEDGTTKTYTLTVTTTATTSFAAIPVTGDETLNIPPPSAIIPANILSPNGDGKNDTWIVKDIDYYPNNTVTIYDHAGKVVYRKKGYSNEWDGSTGSGAPLPQGTYYYILKLSPDITAIKGFISILRSN
ncbi:cadherin-like beta sandwich domain-containing protein [Mucilaginibacter sp. dw_454]|uniref:cadherin-like beta sandwich domain-containing protein n=1 Tax=Mucilaginibacter sp. dw_454 TaxID=2720079 RepID=UPI001BD454E2|nr:cadherin-like beta sandwich domain-containing protein [Mucilaginibacter sp. dw_454]